MYNFFLTCFVLTTLAVANRVTTRSGFAADATVIDPPQRLIVVSERARTMAGNDSMGEVPQGTVISVIRANANWRYSPDCKGWVHVRDTIPLDRAISELDSRIAHEPSSMHYQLRGIIWMTREEWSRAAQDFEKAYDLGESAPNLHYNLGQCYEHLGELASAMREYDSILSAYSDEVPTLIARGNLLLQGRQVTAGLRDLERATLLSPKNADAHNSRGIALRMLGRYDDATAAYTRAIELDPARADAYCNRGFAKKQLGNDTAALQDYEKAYKIAPGSNSIRNDLAWLLATSPDAAIRNPKRAIELAEAVCVATQNHDGDYLDTLAAAFASDGRFSAAEETVKLAILNLEKESDAAPVKERLSVYQNKKPYLEEMATRQNTPAVRPK